MADGPARVFVSFTARDLAAHADVVCAVLRKLQLLAIDHRDAGAQGDPSVEWCRRQVEQCDIVIVLVAHRYGWVPPVDEGGDGHSSITWLEVKHARQHGKTVLPYLLAPDAPWRIDWVEPLQDPAVAPKLEAFKRELGRSVAGFFTDAESLDGPVSRNVRDALDDLRRARAAAAPSTPPAPAAARAGEPQLRPWIFSRDTPPSVAERWLGSHPKRVLCLDAAGAEAPLMLAWLERLERLLQARYGEADFRLADYFDLIAGSGVGAVVAAGLALGARVDEAGGAVREHVGLALSRRRWLMGALMHSGFDSGPMAEALARRFGDAPMHAQRWRTGVALVGARLERGLPCHYDNAPAPEAAAPGPALPLHAVLTGCVSELTLHRPVLVPGPDGTPAALISADVVGAANPSLYVLMQLTGERLRWRLGRHQLRVISVGGLARSLRRDPQTVAQANLLSQLGLLVDAMVQGTAESARTLLHGLSAQEDSPLDFHRFELPVAASARLGEIAALDAQDRVMQWDALSAIGREFAAAGLPPQLLSPAFDVRLTDTA